jgi:hypothetical protein
MNQQEAPKAVILSGLPAGQTRRKSMSYEDIKQSTDSEVRKTNFIGFGESTDTL